jgi:hypothetical protein
MEAIQNVIYSLEVIKFLFAAQRDAKDKMQFIRTTIIPPSWSFMDFCAFQDEANNLLTVATDRRRLNAKLKECQVKVNEIFSIWKEIENYPKFKPTGDENTNTIIELYCTVCKSNGEEKPLSWNELAKNENEIEYKGTICCYSKRHQGRIHLISTRIGWTRITPMDKLQGNGFQYHDNVDRIWNEHCNQYSNDDFIIFCVKVSDLLNVILPRQTKEVPKELQTDEAKVGTLPKINGNIVDIEFVWEHYLNKAFVCSRNTFDTLLVNGNPDSKEKISWIYCKKKGRPCIPQLKLFVEKITGDVENTGIGYIKQVFGMTVKVSDYNKKTRLDRFFQELTSHIDAKRLISKE